MESAAPVSAPAGGALALSPAAVGGRRHLKKVSAKTIRRTLKKLGMKPKGRVVLKGGEGMEAEEPAAAPAPAATAGKRKTKKGKRSASRRKSIFGL